MRRTPSESDQSPETPSDWSGCCTKCGITETPMWRMGPNGNKTLCNACGIRWRRTISPGKLEKRKRKRASSDKNEKHRKRKKKENNTSEDDNDTENEIESAEKYETKKYESKKAHTKKIDIKAKTKITKKRNTIHTSPKKAQDKNDKPENSEKEKKNSKKPETSENSTKKKNIVKKHDTRHAKAKVQAKKDDVKSKPENLNNQDIEVTTNNHNIEIITNNNDTENTSNTKNSSEEGTEIYNYESSNNNNNISNNGHFNEYESDIFEQQLHQEQQQQQYEDYYSEDSLLSEEDDDDMMTDDDDDMMSTSTPTAPENYRVGTHPYFKMRMNQHRITADRLISPKGLRAIGGRKIISPFQLDPDRPPVTLSYFDYDNDPLSNCVDPGLGDESTSNYGHELLIEILTRLETLKREHQKTAKQVQNIFEECKKHPNLNIMCGDEEQTIDDEMTTCLRSLTHTHRSFPPQNYFVD